MNELRAYTLGSFIRTSWGIYRREWLTLFSIYIIPLLVVHIVDALLKHAFGAGVVIILAMAALQLLASMLVTFPATVAVSEICLGIKPSVRRSYQRGFAQPGRALGTYLLAFAIIILGLIALLVPGVVLSLWYTLIGPVVVLEGLSGRAALRRSRELGKGYYLRNLGVLWVVMFVMLLAAMVLGAIVGLTGYLAGVDPKVLDFLSGLAGLLVAPPVPIFMVLLYYDMRVRKEGYGAAQLADDLRF